MALLKLFCKKNLTFKLFKCTKDNGKMDENIYNLKKRINIFKNIKYTFQCYLFI